MSGETWGPPTCSDCAYWLHIEWLMVDLCSNPESDLLRVSPCEPACERFERFKRGRYGDR